MFVLCLVLSWAAPADPAVAETPAVSQEDTMPVVLDDSIPDVATVRDELSLRLGGRDILLAATPGDAPPNAFFWVGASEAGNGDVLVEVIVSDGRLYQRRVREPPEGEEARVLAGALGNLVDGIARRALKPTRTAVEVPALVQPDAVPEPEEEVVVVTPPDSPPAKIEDASPSKTERAVAAVWGGGGLALGVGPPTDVTGPSAAGGGLGGAWLAPVGLTVGGSIRAAAWRRGGVRITRVRLAAEVGYLRSWTRGSVGVRGGPFVEPLWIDAEVRRPSGGVRPDAPLVGLAAVVSPRVRVAEVPGVSLWLGPDVEVGVSAEAARPFGAVRVLRDAQTPLLRAGGVELAFGVAFEARLVR